MLPSASRLRRRTDFAAAIRRGRRAGRTRLVVHFDHDLDLTVSAAPASGGTPVPAAAPVLAGFVVGKVVGGAVVRNRVRRQLRHLVATRISSLPAGSRLVVRALAPAAGASSAALAADLDAALARAQRTATTPKKPQVNAS